MWTLRSVGTRWTRKKNKSGRVACPRCCESGGKPPFLTCSFHENKNQMRVALIGYGVMGQLVAAEARKAGDEVGAVITSRENNQLTEKLRGHDVAIDFSVGEAVLRNVEACLRAQVRLVEGATGWKQHEADVK